MGQSSKQAFVGALVDGGVYSEPKMPVEGEGTCNDGTRDGHWSEAVMGNELMTGFINSGSNPLSAMTGASLRDLGYVVNDVPSDPYTVPSVIGRAPHRCRGRPGARAARARCRSS